VATVWIPALLRPLCDGAHTVEATGETLRALIDDLDSHCPGIAARLLDGGRIRPEIAVWIDGDEADDVTTPVGPASELQIVPAIAGG